ncbi:hypothetical protein IT407_00760 [Candidatus Uhrbacteria bacterium]|nr:hypothetical protein [Candidatus Uhrbacteria bacterium]
MHKKILSVFVALAILGAGCQPAAPSITQPSKPEPVPAKQGFGKIPNVLNYGALGSAEAISARPMGAPIAAVSPLSSVQVQAPTTAPAKEPAANFDVAVTNVGGGTAGSSGVARIMPYPEPNQAKVVYNVTASLPTWGSESDVYRVRLPSIDVSSARSIISVAGVPSQISNGISAVQYANVSWKDNEGFVWNTDIPSRNLNWWKEIDWSKEQPRERREVRLDKERVLAAADAFLRSHGLGSFAGQGIIQEYPEIMPLLRGESMPCIMAEPAAAEDAKMMIYPSPCGGYPMQVSVVYPEMRGGLPVVGSGGWPSNRASVSVDIESNTVMGGNVFQVNEEDASAYPLITSEEALKRLNAGGNNPVYGWYGEAGTSEVRVTISSVKIGWMRHETWADNQSRIFILPALIAEGTIDRGMSGQEPEKYQTVVPLVADEAFQTPNLPVMQPLMDGAR